MKKTSITYSLLFLLSFTFLFNFSLKANDNDSTERNSMVQKNEETIKEDSISKQKIYVFEIHQEIGPAATRITRKAINKAESLNSDYIIVDLNTYGGLVTDADSIRSILMGTEIPTMVYIRNNAASAGALISIACDSIYMNEGSTIGAAAVVNQEGEIMPEKYQSYMRKKMRSTAESTNRDPDIAEGMVDPKIVIEGVSDSTQIITFTVKEALENGYCNGKATSIEEVLEIANITDYEITNHQISIIEKIIAFLINPAFSGVLLLIIIGGIYFELQTPGVGFPILASAIAATLYFAPLYIEGLAANWEIILFFVGIILLLVEVFVLPGFGVAGVAGIVSIVVSLTFALVRNINGFDFSFVPFERLGLSFLMVSSILVGGIILLLFGSNNISKSNMIKRLALNASLSKESGNVISAAVSEQSFVGKKGIVVNDLRPSGKIEVDGIYHDAQSDGEYLEKGTEVIVQKVSGAYLLVDKVS